VPVIVSVGLPTGVLVEVVIVSVELTPGATEVELKDDVTPVGKPLTLRLIEPVKPLRAAVFTVYVVLPPATTV
jgi:hypothetical protein